MGENIGAVVCGMWNFGLDRMCVIVLCDGWPNQRVVVMASGVGWLLDEVQLFEDMAAVIADCDFVYAIMVCLCGLTKLVLSSEAVMQDVYACIVAGGKVAVMFGPERVGMENDDIVCANVIILVLVNSDFLLLNFV